MNRIFVEQLRQMAALLVSAYDLALEHMPEDSTDEGGTEASDVTEESEDGDAGEPPERDSLDHLCEAMSGDDCRDLARLLGVHTTSIYAWRQRGRVPASRREVFETWITSRSEHSPHS